MDCYWLADGLVDRIFDVELFQCVVTRIQHTKNTYYTVMINLIVSKIEGQQFVVGKEKLGYHHGTIGLDFVIVEIQILKVGAFFQRFSQKLSSFTLDFVSLEVETEKPLTLGNEVGKSLSSLISDLIKTQIDIFNVDSILIESCT